MAALTTIPPVAYGCCHMGETGLSAPLCGCPSKAAHWCCWGQSSTLQAGIPPTRTATEPQGLACPVQPPLWVQEAVLSPLSISPAGQLTLRGECRHTQRHTEIQSLKLKSHQKSGHLPRKGRPLQEALCGVGPSCGPQLWPCSGVWATSRMSWSHHLVSKWDNSHISHRIIVRIKALLWRSFNDKGEMFTLIGQSRSPRRYTSKIDHVSLYRPSPTCDLMLLFCERDTHPAETELQSLIFSWASYMQYDTLSWHSLGSDCELPLRHVITRVHNWYSIVYCCASILGILLVFLHPIMPTKCPSVCLLLMRARLLLLRQNSV